MTGFKLATKGGAYRRRRSVLVVVMLAWGRATVQAGRDTSRDGVFGFQKTMQVEVALLCL